MGRGRQARLPRGQPARGVRRRWRRHVRAVAGDGGAGGRRLRAAADGGLAGHQRHDHQPSSAPRSRRSAGCPGIADGSITMAFAITEPDAGSNSHKITTTARRDGSDWILNGQKVYISGVDQAQAVLVVARTEEAKTGKLKPGAVRGAHRHARLRLHARSTWRSSAPNGSSRCSSTTSGCPPTRSSAPRTPRSRSCSPG